MFWENFFKLCVYNNTKPLKVVQALDIGSGSITKWKNGTIPNGETLLKIANYFNVTTDYLLGLTATPERKVEDNPIYVSYNALNDIDKEKVKAYINDLLQAQKYTELVTPYKTNKVREIAAFGGKSTNGTPPKKKPEIT